MASQNLIPGLGFVNETETLQNLVPGGGFLNETTSTADKGSFRVFHVQPSVPFRPLRATYRRSYAHVNDSSQSSSAY